MTTRLLSTTWHTLVGELELDPGEFLLYLDPHGLDDVESENGEIVTVDDRWQFRRLAGTAPATIRAVGAPAAHTSAHS